MKRTELESRIANEPTVFIVGAGLSTASGIRDFASLQQEFDTTELLSIEAYYQHYWQQHDFMSKYLMNQSVQPNLGHRWIAQLSQLPNIRIISQNIDSLLETAGTDTNKLLKIHGTLDQFSNRDGNPVDISEQAYTELDHSETDRLIRPNIVFYGENVKGMNQAIDWMTNAKYVVVIGSRLNVAPVNQLTLFGNHLAEIFVINREPVAPLQNNIPVTQINVDIDTWLKDLD